MSKNSLITATDPNNSVWVSASAGTGKTKILTSRVLRLLVEGISPEKILCLTFTNAGAGEMLSRIQQSLKDWAIINKEDLENQLKELLGYHPKESITTFARQLFKKQIMSGRLLKIYTIHAFCQNLLQRFPYEAGVNPGFKVIDEIKAKTLLNKIINDNLALTDNIDEFLKHVSLFRIKELLAETTLYLKTVSTGESLETNKLGISLEEFSQKLSKFLNCEDPYQPPLTIIEELKSSIKEILSIEDLIPYCEEAVAFTIVEFLKQPITDLDDVKPLTKSFLTSQGESRKKLLPKKITDKNSLLLAKLNQIQELVILKLEQLTSLEFIKKTKLLYHKSLEIYQNYEAEKNKQNLLDYQDLINHTYYLLCRAEMRDWVQYKLDGGISHILVDEAQDTSEHQWRIIYSLVQDFFSGQSARSDEKRSLFVVGDVKQSIYSFQGARPDLFTAMQEDITSQAIASRHNFSILELQTTYRLAPAILNILEQIFLKLPSIKYNTSQLSYRDNDYGRVEIWPWICNEKTPDFFWPLPSELTSFIPTERQLAIKIAKDIKTKIEDNTYLSSKKRKVSAGDFLILVRRRSSFIEYLNEELNKFNIPTAGVDRLNLIKNQAIQYLLAAARFTYDPYNDLNLAILLKSPIFGLNDTDLLTLRLEGNNQTLWETLNNFAHEHSKSIAKLNLLLEISSLYSPAAFFRHVIYRFNMFRYYEEDNKLDFIDIIEEFLVLIASIEDNEQFNLAQAVDYFANQEIEVKRDLPSNFAVRIMTVHGAKGLQAPIVIVADTTSFDSSSNSSLLTTNDGKDELLIWPGKYNSHAIVDKAKQQRKITEYEEYLRLLYVALTRAEDQLLICGSGKKEEFDSNSWYGLVYDTLSKIGAKNNDDIIYFESGILPENGIVIHPNTAVETIEFTPFYNNFKFHSSFKNKFSNVPMKTSETSTILSEASLLGTALHKALEDWVRYKDLGITKNNFYLNQLSTQEQENAKLILEAIFQNEELNNLLNNWEVKPEVTLGTFAEGCYKVMRIDLLAIKDEKIIIIDYKSDTFLPITVPTAYQAQIAQYIKAISGIYPNKRIEARILWLRHNKWQNVSA